MILTSKNPAKLSALSLGEKRGWFRIWLIIAFLWFIFAAYQVKSPWAPQTSEVFREGYSREEEIDSLLASGLRVASKQCESNSVEQYVSRYSEAGSLSRAILSDRGIRSEKDLETELNYVSVSCILHGQRFQRWGDNLTQILLPPIIVPVALILIFLMLRSIGRWVIDGFRVNAPRDPRSNAQQEPPSATPLQGAKVQDSLAGVLILGPELVTPRGGFGRPSTTSTLAEQSSARDWRRLPAWALVLSLLSVVSWPIPPEYWRSPIDVALILGIGITFYAGVGILLATALTLLTKKTSRATFPFVTMNNHYSTISVVVGLFAVLARVFFPDNLTYIVALVPVFLITRGIGRTASRK